MSRDTRQPTRWSAYVSAVATAFSNRYAGGLISMRRHVFLTFVLPYVILFSLIMWVAERAATHTAVLAATTRFEQMGLRTLESLARLEEPALNWLATMTQNPSQGLKGMEDLSLLRVHMAMLSRSPHLASVYFGHSNGDFARVLNLVDPAFRSAIQAPPKARYAVQFVRPLPLASKDYQAQETLDFYDAAMRPLRGSRSQTTEYDPRKRPWFEAASDKSVGEVVSTPPYQFAYPVKLGITLSAQLGVLNGSSVEPLSSSQSANPTLAGAAASPSSLVIGGVDFALSGLSEYLANLSSSPSVQSYIFDDLGRLWAWSDASHHRRLLSSGTTPQVSNLPDASQRQLLQVARERRLLRGTQQINDGEYFEVHAPDGTPLSVAVFSVARLGTQDVYVALTDARSNVFSAVRQLRLHLLAIGIAGLIGGGMLIGFLARRLAVPLDDMAQQTQLLERFRFDEIKPHPSAIRELAQLQSSLTLARIALSGYARFIPQPLVKHYLALRTEPKPGVESREIVAMYASSSRALYRELGPSASGLHALAGILQHIEASRGVTDRIDNLGVGAFWNAPLLQNNPSLRACEAALQALEWIDELGRTLPKPWSISFGVDMGMAAVGNFGSPDGRLIYGVAGPPVQNALDLSRQGQRLAIPILISESVAAHVDKYFELSPIMLSQPDLKCYAIVGRKAGIRPLRWKDRPKQDLGDATDQAKSAPSDSHGASTPSVGMGSRPSV